MKKLWVIFSGFAPWARLVIGLAVLLLVVGLGIRMTGAVKYLIFGDTEAKREHANTVVAQEQTKAEANVADKTIATVHERDVYREHITNVVHDSQGKIHAVDQGQPMDPAIDAAVAAGLCSVHDSLCRRLPGPAPVQPVR